MRTFRNRTTVLAAATTAALALTLTACGDDGTGTKSAGPAAAESSPAASSSQAAEQAGTVQKADATQADATTAPAAGAKDSGTKDAGTKGTGGSSTTAPVCTTKDVRISSELQDGPPYTHIVLTAKNTSGHSCRMQDFPEIRFLENALGTVPPVAKSKPPVPIVLTAGAPAYALVKLSDGGMHDDVRTVKDFSVTLKGNGGMAVVKAPGAEGIAVDPAKWATGYWTYELRNGADDF
ncbi:DUF4232 domain-containing protein [Streptomyces sp. NBC_01754]|uniref:DUF4232 domain-containing protein n=1 Tax=Streptomyces sp. NBC_01754 TaxID=2975930 RepID=UPI002DD837C8|nr:DUF4232 domain-containing protein [Streptomyces sp. NBC_01754]WSC93527.1 DUF4232 domain-containing protein [Streptomyces sp. NBC_01754]